MCRIKRIIPVVSLLGFFSMSAWCSRMDGGKSGYGMAEGPCPVAQAYTAGALPAGLTVTCGSAASFTSPTTTIFDFHYTGSVIPSLSLFVTFPQGNPDPLNPDPFTDGTFGVILDDTSSSTVPGTGVTDNSSQMITSASDLSFTPGLPTITFNNVGNVPGDIVVYFTAPAELTNVNIGQAAATPEPSYVVLLGLGLLAIGLWSVRRRSQVSCAAR